MGCFEAMLHDLREILRLAASREPTPSAVTLKSRMLQSTPESGGRAGHDGAKKRKGWKVHLAVDTLGDLLALVVTPANGRVRAQVKDLAAEPARSTSASPTLPVACRISTFGGASAA